MSQLTKTLENGTRSTIFLASLVSSYMLVVSANRKILELKVADIQRDHKLSFYLAGVISSLSILIENESRRTELALYCLPRAAESLSMIMAKRGLVSYVPHSETALFCFSMMVIMHCFEHEDDGLTGFLRAILNFFLR